MPLYPSEDELVRVPSQSLTAFGTVKNLSICRNVVRNRRFLCCNGKWLVLPDTTDATDKLIIILKTQETYCPQGIQKKEVPVSTRLVTSVDLDSLIYQSNVNDCKDEWSVPEQLKKFCPFKLK